MFASKRSCILTRSPAPQKLLARHRVAAYFGRYGDNPFTVFSGGQSVKNCVVGITYKWRGLCRSLRLCRRNVLLTKWPGRIAEALSGRAVICKIILQHDGQAGSLPH